MLVGCILIFLGWDRPQLKNIDNCLLFVWRLRNTWLITCLLDCPLEIRISEKSRKSSESENLKTSSKKIRILNHKGLLFIYCALLKPQLWFCMHMSSSCARIYRCIFTSSHIICIMKIHPIVNSAQDLLHMLWFYSFLVLKLFTTSADHELSFSKIIRINHSSCSLCSLTCSPWNEAPVLHLILMQNVRRRKFATWRFFFYLTWLKDFFSTNYFLKLSLTH